MKIKDLQIDEEMKRELLFLIQEIFIFNKGEKFTELGELLEKIENKYGKDMFNQIKSSEEFLAAVNDETYD